ncbi:helix-turn-helix domain-containing protein [Rhodococcus sp. 7Tela_A2]|uniref:helix-turn-helix domain-containing protein n=1 Tax=Rhodococcus sp. 7Tela_A2 TaxID=3093744 RepID=UPI003BB66F9B
MVRLPLSPQQLAAGKRLGGLLREARRDRTLADVAASAGISPETLRKIETGRLATPGFVTVAALARALALPLDDLARVCLDAEEFEDAARSSAGRRPPRGNARR